MKSRLLAALAAFFILFSNCSGFAAETAGPTADLKTLVEHVKAKIKAGQTKEADLADNLKEFDALLEKYKDQKTDDVAQILIMKGMLYIQVMEAPEKGLAVFEQLKKDFPDTTPGKQADKVIASIKHQIESKKMQASLTIGSQFPDFAEKDLAGKPLSVANYKGKIVLLDFWATWCGPCVHELPNVIKTYGTYHPKGFEIIGVSLDEDKAALDDFLKKQNMPWVQYFDGKGWENKLAGQYGITSIPATFLLDGSGKIIGRDLRGEALEAAVAKALTAKP